MKKIYTYSLNFILQDTFSLTLGDSWSTNNDEIWEVFVTVYNRFPLNVKPTILTYYSTQIHSEFPNTHPWILFILIYNYLCNHKTKKYIWIYCRISFFYFIKLLLVWLCKNICLIWSFPSNLYAWGKKRYQSPEYYAFLL